METPDLSVNADTSVQNTLQTPLASTSTSSGPDMPIHKGGKELFLSQTNSDISFDDKVADIFQEIRKPRRSMKLDIETEYLGSFEQQNEWV